MIYTHIYKIINTRYHYTGLQSLLELLYNNVLVYTNEMNRIDVRKFDSDDL